jgi:hypothetical protein
MALEVAFVTGGMIILGSLVVNALDVLIRRLFRSPVTIDWKFKIGFSLAIALMWSLIMFVSTLADLRGEDLRDKTQNPSFPGSWFYRGIFGLGAVGCPIGMIGLYQQHESLWYELIPLVMLALVWFIWPRTIHFYPDAIGQKTRLGQMRWLDYRAVEYVAYDKRDRCTIVAGRGTKIVHTPCHVNALLFQELIQERTGKAVLGA